MVSIRLSRVGKKNHPLFRIVVQDKQKDPYGPALDFVGFYNPHTSPSTIDLDEAKLKDWIAKGAQPTNTVWNMLVNAGIVEGKKRKSVKLKPSAKTEEDAKGAAAPAAPAETPKEAAPTEAPKNGAEEAKKEEPQQEAAAE